MNFILQPQCPGVSGTHQNIFKLIFYRIKLQETCVVLAYLARLKQNQCPEFPDSKITLLPGPVWIVTTLITPLWEEKWFLTWRRHFIFHRQAHAVLQSLLFRILCTYPAFTALPSKTVSWHKHLNRNSDTVIVFSAWHFVFLSLSIHICLPPNVIAPRNRSVLQKLWVTKIML